MFVKRAITHPSRAKVRAWLCRSLGVTEERLVQIIEARKRLKKARRERRRSRARVLTRNGGKHRMPGPVLHAGEGRFHELLKLAGMTESQFAAWAGMGLSTVKGWYGFPLYEWPIMLLERELQIRKMSEVLTKHGWDPEKFKPGHLPKAPQGDYPRTTEQGKQIIRGLDRGDQ